MFPRFDTSKLRLRPLAERQHDMTMADVLQPTSTTLTEHASLEAVAAAIRRAKSEGAPVIVFMGAHVIKTGMSRFIRSLMKNGWIDHLAMNGACAIHDYELALQGATTESVAEYIRRGEFGLWRETGHINDIVAAGVKEGLGFGEALGREIQQGAYPHRDVSLLASGQELGVPVTVHVAFGQDIVHEHPNFNPAAVGTATYDDFLILTASMAALEGGVVLNLGSAVMGPEVYLKALSMVRNVACQGDERIDTFTTAVFDIQPLGKEDIHREPAKDKPQYYHRYWKTMLVRTVQDGGQSYYVEGHHRDTISGLWQRLVGGAENE